MDLFDWGFYVILLLLVIAFLPGMISIVGSALGNMDANNPAFAAVAIIPAALLGGAIVGPLINRGE